MSSIIIPEGEVYSLAINGVIVWEVPKYLTVSPEDVQWITPDSDVVYNVESNTDWTVT